MEQTKRLLVQVKSDIEHLANKVHHLKAVSLVKNYTRTDISKLFLQIRLQSH